MQLEVHSGILVGPCQNSLVRAPVWVMLRSTEYCAGKVWVQNVLEFAKARMTFRQPRSKKQEECDSFATKSEGRF
jgi:hypothetical protein